MKRAFPFSHKNKRVSLATVSGVASTKPSLIKYFDRSVDAVSLITTKSFQVKPNSGNREPVICEDEIGVWGNSVGLRNPGMEKALEEIKALRADGISKWLNISLSADNENDFITLVKAFSPYADSVELNFSCPHAKKGFGASIGSNKETASSYVKAINEATADRDCLLFVKLTPNVDAVEEIAASVIESGADGIVAINTVGPVDHREKNTGLAILNNPIGGKGGKSGDDIFSLALEDIRKIRTAVGEDVPIIGMGGVSDGERAALLTQAGADVVGVGSALGRVNQKMWPEYLALIKKEGDAFLSSSPVPLLSRTLLREKTAMDYTPYEILSLKLHSPDTLILTLNGEVEDFKAGQFVFLWLPGYGEKPFSLARVKPLTFIIKKRGIFTSHLFEEGVLSPGKTIYIRGPYGGEVETLKTRKALIILGGTGEAVADPLSDKLEKEGTEITYLVGTSVDGGKGIFEDVLSKRGSYHVVSDSGKVGRVLDYIQSTLSGLLIDGTALSDVGFYLIGPEIFMKKASSILKERGIESDKIMLSMERNSMCGVGLCGECASGSRLACQWGTFFLLSFLEEENVL